MTRPSVILNQSYLGLYDVSKEMAIDLLPEDKARVTVRYLNGTVVTVYCSLTGDGAVHKIDVDNSQRGVDPTRMNDIGSDVEHILKGLRISRVLKPFRPYDE